MPVMEEIQRLVLIPLLNEVKFVIVWLSAPIILAGAYELLCFFGKDESDQISRRENYRKTLLSNFRSNLNLTSIVSYIVFVALLGIYIYLMFLKENFSYYDNFQFTHSNLIGKPYHMPIWRDSGRFWPLGLQEYNFLALIGKSFFTYQAFAVIQLLAVIILIYNIFSEFPIKYRIATIAVVIIIPSFAISFFGLIYPERNVIFWLSILIFCRYSLTKLEDTSPRIFLYGALISTQFCLYYKEPVFILIGSFSFFSLLISSLKNRCSLDSLQSFFRFIKNNYVDTSLLLLSILYISLYKIIVLSEVSEKYFYNSKSTIIDTFHSYIDNSLLITIFSIIVIIRLSYLILSKKIENNFWDLLALGALLYFLTFLSLKMYTKYYLAPAEFIAVLYLSQLAYEIYHFWDNKKAKRRILNRFLFLTIASFSIFLLIVQAIQTTSYEILSRKSLVSGNMQLASKIREYKELHNQEETSLFFPSSTGSYLIMNFGSFLEYLEYKDKVLNYRNNRSISTESSSSLAIPGSEKYQSAFVLKSPLEFKDNLCVEWFYINCFQSIKPQSDDLIVLLPGLARGQDFKDLKANSKILFSYHYEINLEPIERVLLAISNRKNFSHTDVYIFQKKNYGDTS